MSKAGFIYSVFIKGVTYFMNAVGIDVSKGRSTVAILRPLGEIVYSPFEVKHSTSGIKLLVDRIKETEGETRIVMDHLELMF